jgi:VWFA-related protein
MNVPEILSGTDAASWVVCLLVVRATGTVLLAAAALALLRRASAAVRHATLVLTVAALLALPLLSSVLPRWELGLLPAPIPSVATGHGVAPVTLHLEGLRAASKERVESPSRAAIARDAAIQPDAALATRSGTQDDAPRALPRAVSLSIWLLVVWMAGVALGMSQLLVAVVLVRRASRATGVMSEPEWLETFAQAMAYLGLKRHVRLLSSPAVGVPIVYGYWNAAVMLPANASTWPEDRRRAFLLHELAHVARHDCLTQTLAHIARLLYWPNPLAWWLVKRLRAEAERACDDRVLSAGTPASDYAAHLLDAARDLSRARRPIAVLAVVERSRLEDRLLALLDPGLRRGVLTRRGLALGAGLSIVVACSVAALQPVARAVASRALASAPSVGIRETSPLTSRSVQSQAIARAPQLAEPTVARAVGAVLPPTPALVSTPTSAPAPLEPVVDAPFAEPPVVAAITVQEPPPSGGSGVPKPEPALALGSPTVNPAIPVIRISTDLIQIDAVVTDKAGHPIVDLQPSDFEVFESGRKQTISHFVYVKTGQGPTSGGNAALAAAPQTIEPRTVVIVVDDLSLSLHSSVLARKALEKLVKTRLEPTDRVAILKVSGGARTTPFSSDPAELGKQVAQVRYNINNRRPWNQRENFFDQSRNNAGRNPDDVSWNSFLAVDSLSLLKATVDALRAVPGRKALIFVSEGFPLLISDDRSRRLESRTFLALDAVYDDMGIRAALNGLIDLANRASVVIYSIDPGGLTTGSAGLEVGNAEASSSGATGQLPQPVQVAQSMALDHLAQQDSLIELAEATGGIAVHDQNDISVGLQRVLADHAGYYLIGYEPQAATFARSPNGIEFHKVKVEVTRPGLRVRSRRGFYGVSDEVIAKAAPPRTN